MKTFKLILPALALSLFVACSATTPDNGKVAATADADNQMDTTLVATMAIPAALTANSPIEINPKDSLSIKVDLTKAYDIKAGNYVVRYNSQAISGLNVTDSVQISVK
ncbi:MAG: hypothetical protein EOO91_09030 [Pedobacter sp.]|nr:MAG: hypothetical protein EOO91_09030 [Pedobacter sp.]